MSKRLMQSDWSDTKIKWSESDLQIAQAQWLKRHKEYNNTFTFAGDQNGLSSSPVAKARAKAEGLQAGEPDMRLYFNNCRLVLVENKRKGNYASEVQKERIALLEKLGYTCYIVTANCPNDAVEKMKNIVEKHLAKE